MAFPSNLREDIFNRESLRHAAYHVKVYEKVISFQKHDSSSCWSLFIPICVADGLDFQIE